MSDSAGMARFGELARGWFAESYEAPTAAQIGAWDAIADGGDVLVVAPTGSGKTLAAFLSAIDRLSRTPVQERPAGTSVLYISPLKALGVDVQRNLRGPLAGLSRMAALAEQPAPDITVGVRTGDTEPGERRRLLSHPPDILITTPESLFLMLTSRGRETLAGLDTIIIDEIHALAGTKRGAHLAVSLERLTALADRRPQRIGLSATVRPTAAVAEYLSGNQPAIIVEAPSDKRLEIRVEIPVPDLTDLAGASAIAAENDAPGEPPTRPRDTPSIWPHIESRLVDLIASHRSTLVFTNSRRQAERVTARLNEEWAQRLGQELPGADEVAADMPGMAGQSSGAPALLARAHHGSVSKEQRAQIEESLKRGDLPAVVATSSLELGIDMGAVDLVVQIESPPSVAAGLQRVGRAGHQVGAVSRGVFFPKHRGDLLTSAVVADQMERRRIEELRLPRNPLDVLAQQVVAMVAMDDWQVADLLELLQQCAPFRTLTEPVLHSVLDMLAGRYPADDFASLKPRLTWDRAADVLSARPGAQRLAVTSGGTIPDRGLYGVYLIGGEDRGGQRVGELDEEMVYESRIGDVFSLGTSTWRIEDITADRVLVSPAPGRAGKLPFWHGDTIGRPYELGQRVGEFTRDLVTAADAGQRLRGAGLGDWAADNLVAYLAEQQQATGTVPDDRTIVVERFRDEIGDWRVIWHSPFGARVHTPWALAIGAALREMFGADAQVMATDDGIIAHLPDTGGDEWQPLLAQVGLPDPAEIDDLVRTEVVGSALFASRFREAAGRALLLPRRDPKRRTPLWQQRQRSAQLLAAASRYPAFPITLEAMRECVQDVYDLPSLRSVLTDIHSGRIRIVDVETPRPSPFAQSLLFSYVANYLYEGDSPLAERRSQALALDPELLAQLLGDAQLRDLLDPDALAEVEADLQLLTDRRRVSSVDGAADALRNLGPLTGSEASDRGITGQWLDELVAARRAFHTRIGGREVLAAAEDAARLRDAVGAPLPPGLPTAFLEPVGDPVGDLVGRYARTHGPFTARDAASALGLGPAVVEAQLRALSARHTVAAGEFRPGGAGAEWCSTEVLRRIRRASAAALARTIEPVGQDALARFLPRWQGVAPSGRKPTLRGADGVFAAIEQLAGVPVPASAWESLVLPARVADYRPELLDSLTTSGDVVWWGTAELPGGDGWVCLAPSDMAADLRPPAEDLPEPDDPLALAVMELLGAGGAWFLTDLHPRLLTDHPSATQKDLLDSLWRLVWAGRATNDSFAALRSLRGTRPGPGGGRPPGRMARRGPGRRPLAVAPPTGSGRWSVPPLGGDATRAAAARAEQLLSRHGLVVRGSLLAEAFPGGFAASYRVLGDLAAVGRANRIYLVEGLGGAQFAAPGVVDRVREQAEPGLPIDVLAATDPANPFGAALPWPSIGPGGHRPGRKSGSVVVICEGRLQLYLERGGKSLLTFCPPDEPALPAGLEALAAVIQRGSLGRVTITRVDSTAVTELGSGPLQDALNAAGFRLTPRGLRLPSR